MNMITLTKFTKTKIIGIIAVDVPELLDFAGPAQVFSIANRVRKTSAPNYCVKLFSVDGRPVETPSGLSLCASPIEHLGKQQIDTLIIAAGRKAAKGFVNRQIIEFLTLCTKECRRICAVDAAAFLLASAGLLKKKRATIHWRYIASIKQQYPELKLEQDIIFLKDDRIWTSAGASASIDLSLALIQEDLGQLTALEVAKSLILFMKRPGTQAQFSAPLRAQLTSATAGSDERFIALHAWISSRLSEKITVEQLAQFVGMSPRNFYRTYTAITGVTPAKGMEILRLEAARREISSSITSLKRIAESCGFGSEERMRHAFLRCYGVNPTKYRTKVNGKMALVE